MLLSQQQLAAYFDRIGLCYDTYKDRPLDYPLLRELNVAHAITMPFENLDILEGKLLSLDGEALYDKLITRHRGGNCFELNGLCGIFLRSLGFGVSDYFSRFFRDANGQIPMRRHRLLKVETLDGPYVWDIGIGMRSPLYPLRLVEGLCQKQFGQCYKFVREEFYGWVLYEFYKGEWLRILSFTEEPQADVDFVTACVWCELHPSSPFRQQRMIAIKTMDGRKTLDGNVFKVFRGEELITLRELEEPEVPSCLKEQFGLTV
ncbi:MAG: arylamine N-acetyltransferase [Oscillospiraceae bacterium]|nr:arylamine N-acetyltransferase [Oscillospiraceae bacterium]